MSGKKDVMTLKEAADEVNVTSKALWAAIKKGLLDAEKHGRDWFVTKEALHDWQNNRNHKSGRPRKTD